MCATALRVGALPPIDLGLLYRDSLYQVAKVPVHLLCLGLVRLEDRSEHLGRRNHVLHGDEEVPRAVTTFSDLITNLPRPTPFGFEAYLLNVFV